jgi:myo-inositol-1-phosphate synthase
MRYCAHTGPAGGKLAVLLVGLGSVSTTFIAGVAAVRKGLARPIGSLTQLGRLSDPTGEPGAPIRDLLPLAPLDDLAFGAWDIFPENACEAAHTAHVLEPTLLKAVSDELEGIRPRRAVFDRSQVRRLDGPHIKRGRDKRDLAEQVREDIRSFLKETGSARAVVIWCASTEAFMNAAPAHGALAAFERALDESDPAISASMIYAYAALMEGVPYANAAPNLSVDTPALLELATLRSVPIAGKDLKTGQTLLKTIIAAGLQARLLGVSGWYSTNLLGNRDGEVLADPDSCKTKELSKQGALEQLLRRDAYPELYGSLCQHVQIHYHPPRGDNKEGWDSVDLFGWLGYPMQLKINFLCRDSILAAPLVLDLALFLDLAARAGLSGIQQWLSFYFKSPMHAPGHVPEHDLTVQLRMLQDKLRELQRRQEPVAQAAIKQG